MPNARPLRVASVPGQHVYVRHLSPPAGDARVRRLPDVPVLGAPAGQWWPPPMLDPGWIHRNREDFDVFHVHFGFDDRTQEQLRALVRALRAVRRPLVVTVHDLRNPHHADPAQHTAALDILVPAAAEVVTLTGGAAAEIARRWGRVAVVVPHPHVVDPIRARAARPEHEGFVIGLHAKSKRANSDPVPVAHAVADAVARLPGARLRIDAHDDAAGRAVAARLADLDVRVHRPFSDDELWDYLTDLDASVLPYRFGTHSGWLEACHDLGTTVIAPSCGYYADQGPCLVYDHDESGLDSASLAHAVSTAYRERPSWRADPDVRARQRQEIADHHARLYQAAVNQT
ncbi:Glycosyl transferases group 1 [Actinokineospora globicatena]|nr:Glycosyl transferases group 1 [Actinokineospora globicatena]